MTVIINELEVVAAPEAPAPAVPGTAQAPSPSPTARDVRLVVVHHLARALRVEAT